MRMTPKAGDETRAAMRPERRSDMADGDDEMSWERQVFGDDDDISMTTMMGCRRRCGPVIPCSVLAGKFEAEVT